VSAGCPARHCASVCCILLREWWQVACLMPVLPSCCTHHRSVPRTPFLLRSYTKLYKKHVKIMFPRVSGEGSSRCSKALLCLHWHADVGPNVLCLVPSPQPAEHDPLDITAGYPTPGRPEIRTGDNVS